MTFTLSPLQYFGKTNNYQCLSCETASYVHPQIATRKACILFVHSHQFFPLEVTKHCEAWLWNLGDTFTRLTATGAERRQVTGWEATPGWHNGQIFTYGVENRS